MRPSKGVHRELLRERRGILDALHAPVGCTVAVEFNGRPLSVILFPNREQLGVCGDGKGTAGLVSYASGGAGRPALKRIARVCKAIGFYGHVTSSIVGAGRIRYGTRCTLVRGVDVVVYGVFVVLRPLCEQRYIAAYGEAAAAHGVIRSTYAVCGGAPAAEGVIVADKGVALNIIGAVNKLIRICGHGARAAVGVVGNHEPLRIILHKVRHVGRTCGNGAGSVRQIRRPVAEFVARGRYRSRYGNHVAPYSFIQHVERGLSAQAAVGTRRETYIESAAVVVKVYNRAATADDLRNIADGGNKGEIRIALCEARRSGRHGADRRRLRFC